MSHVHRLVYITEEDIFLNLLEFVNSYYWLYITYIYIYITYMYIYITLYRSDCAYNTITYIRNA